MYANDYFPESSISYFAPNSLNDALLFLRDVQPKVIAGCTDYFPGKMPGQVDREILDVTGVDGFRGITKSENGWRIGAATTWTDIVSESLPTAFDGLKLSAREVGSVQIQNRGTIAGNICNASPAADGVPPLLVLDAQVEISSIAGNRIVAVSDFLKGVRSIDLAADELVVALHIPEVSNSARSSFLKLGSRTHLVISIVMVAAIVQVSNGAVVDARIAVGSCSPVAQRLSQLERSLVGKSAVEIAKLDFNNPDYYKPLNPISDIRGSAEYRLEAVAELVRRSILNAYEGA